MGLDLKNAIQKSETQIIERLYNSFHYSVELKNDLKYRNIYLGIQNI